VVQNVYYIFDTKKKLSPLEKIPTDTGTALNIISEERVIRGENTKVNLYGKAAQELIVENALNIVVFKKE